MRLTEHLLTVAQYCEMLPFYQVCNVTVEDSKWLNPICSAGFSDFVRTSAPARGKNAFIYNVDSLEVKSTLKLTFDNSKLNPNWTLEKNLYI